MSSNRFSETRSYHEESRHDTNPTSYSQRVTVPIQHSSSNYSGSVNEQRLKDRIRQQDTSLQWVNDSISGKEKFRININIEGFDQNEVNIRVDGNKLIVYGEHFENKNQSTAKKIIEKSYELPRDLDTFSPQVTFPSLNTMQVDFPSRHSNVIIDDGRTSTNLISNYDNGYRTPPRVTQERSSTEYTSTRKVGGGSSGDNSFLRSSSPRTQSSYDDVYSRYNSGGNGTYSSTSHYQTLDNRSPLRRDYTESFSTPNNSTYTYRVASSDSQPRSNFPSSSFGDGRSVYEQSYSETRRETEDRRSSPTSGVQTRREVEHRRSGSPSIGRSLDENRFRPSVTFANSSSIAPSSSHNVEVREYSRRIGTGGNNNTSSNFINTEPLFSSHGFNSDAFYRSGFQPQVLTDEHGQKRIEMKLDVNNYQPNEIKVSIEGHDLVVQAEHNVERPPTSSSRAYFYKKVTLPPNTDYNSLSSQYHPDGRLHITAKVQPEQASIRYN